MSHLPYDCVPRSYVMRRVGHRRLMTRYRAVVTTLSTLFNGSGHGRKIPRTADRGPRDTPQERSAQTTWRDGVAGLPMPRAGSTRAEQTTPTTKNTISARIAGR